MRRGFESRGGWGGQVEVEVDGRMVWDTGGERIAEYLALLDYGDMMFKDEVVVKDTVGVRFSKKGVGSIGRGRDTKTAISGNKTKKLIIFKSSRPR